MKIDAKDIKTVLVYVGLDLVGDGLIKLPFVRALRNTYPDSEITWLAGKGASTFSSTLAPLVTGLIDRVVDDTPIGSNWSELLKRPLRGCAIEGQQFDLVIDTQRRLLTTLILRKIPHRYFVSGAGGFALSKIKPQRAYTKPRAMIRQMLDLLELATGGPVKSDAPLVLDKTFHALATDLLPDGNVYVGLAPGAGGKHKCWPLERFCEVANRLAEQEIRPVFLLGPDENSWAENIRHHCPDALLPLQDDRAGERGRSPLLSITLAQRMAAGVANDSGTGHMLAAADIPPSVTVWPDPA